MLLFLYSFHLLYQEWIKRSQQFGFFYHTACAQQYFSVSEKHERRHGLDAELACSYAVLIYIHLDDSDAVAQHTLYLLQNGVHHLAWLAPCSKEIDQNKLATVYYVIECLHNYLSISVKRLKVYRKLHQHFLGKGSVPGLYLLLCRRVTAWEMEGLVVMLQEERGEVSQGVLLTKKSPQTPISALYPSDNCPWQRIRVEKVSSSCVQR